MKRHFFSIAGGIRPDKPGFKSVRIEPKFVTHNSVNIVIPHPQGLIKMELSRDGDLLEGNIELSKELKVYVDSIIGVKPIETSGWLQPFFTGIFDLLGGKSVLEKSLWMCSIILILLTLSRGIFLFFKGKWSATASESIARRIYSIL